MLKEIDTRTARVMVFVLSAAVMSVLMLGAATTAFGATGGDPWDQNPGASHQGLGSHERPDGASPG
jgi:hypothetical protein